MAAASDPRPFVEAMGAAGYRITEPRRMVAGLVAARDGHFTAADLIDEASARRLGIGRATIFRSLDLLTELELLERIDLPTGEHAYVACEPRHHHHIVCDVCGRVAAIDDQGLAVAMDQIQRRTGWQVEAHRLELYGRCPRCRDLKPSQRRMTARGGLVRGAFGILAFTFTLAIVLATVLGGPVSAQSEGPSVVVTTDVLGGVVRDLVGDAAQVTILMKGGADPHSWQPSARDTEQMFSADLVVANGLGLEEGLLAVLAEAEADGVAVFRATDHVDVLAPGEDSHEHVGHDDEHEDGDPHFWLDPLAMREVVWALDAVLADAGTDVAARTPILADELTALDAEIRAILATVPAEARQLISGHGALAYLAARYDFEIIGAVVPGITTSGEASARDLADLVTTARETGATAIFSDTGTSQAVARAVALDSGVEIVELDVVRRPDGGTYGDLMRGIAHSISTALVRE